MQREQISQSCLFIGKAGREVAAEEQLMDLKGKVQNLEKINSHLKEKVGNSYLGKKHQLN